jgi:hypothetical protein
MDGLRSDELDRVFPFHVAVGPDLRVRRLGRSLGKVMPELRVGADLAAHFALDRPPAALTYEALRERGETACARACLS